MKRIQLPCFREGEKETISSLNEHLMLNIRWPSPLLIAMTAKVYSWVNSLFFFLLLYTCMGHDILWQSCICWLLDMYIYIPLDLLRQNHLGIKKLCFFFFHRYIYARVVCKEVLRWIKCSNHHTFESSTNNTRQPD